MATTVGQLISDALTDSTILGVGQTALAEDSSRAFRLLNQMTAQWNRKRWLIWHLIDVSIASTGAQSYTIGPGGDFNVARPDRLEFAFFRQPQGGGSSPVDYVLRIIESREDYDRIVLKQMGTWPDCVFYDSAYPLGNIYVWPVPSSQYSIHLTIKDTISAFTGLTQEIVLPPEYEAALLYNLICRLRSAYAMAPDATMVALAHDALNVLRGANTQIPTLSMPRNVLSTGRSYNVFSDSQ